MTAPSGTGPPALPRPQAPPPGLALARWLYVDEKRTHEVHAGVRQGGGRPEFVVKESAYANDDPDEVYELATPIAESWEGPLLLKQLEDRLALIGTYWRFDVTQPGWTKLHAPPFTSLDMRPVRVAGLYEGRVTFHHWRKKGSPDIIIAGIPQATARGERWLLAQASLTFPLAEEGDVRLFHARLPGVVAWSLLARNHMHLRDAGYQRLYASADYAAAYGKDFADALTHTFETILRRISEGHLGPGLVKDGRPRAIDDVYTDYLANLSDPHLITLHARYLTPEEESRALDHGEAAIKRLIASKRQGVRSQQEHVLLTILEASLLARNGLRAGQPTHVDPEVASLVRRFAFYL